MAGTQGGSRAVLLFEVLRRHDLAGQACSCDPAGLSGQPAMAAWVLVHLLHPGPFPFHVAFVDDRLLCAVNPRWGYTRRKFRKIRFLFYQRAGEGPARTFFGK
ncbi:hypothetical protein [Mesorhizobium sp. SARCC-RB16n]|uniref:hypothetical protein n=1 Tax=Mesorhizobium sp. SARCC-RB16n TaxID=2116687 RepID=UPI001AEEFA8B|nr:hypothetical protein [Mesorhizobium sp. SARCC-RB16n]